MNLIPITEAANGANKALAAGATVFQQFECSNCKAKQTMSEPNKFFIKGECEECGHITDIRKDGCNYALVQAFGGPEAKAQLQTILDDLQKESPRGK